MRVPATGAKGGSGVTLKPDEVGFLFGLFQEVEEHCRYVGVRVRRGCGSGSAVNGRGSGRKMATPVIIVKYQSALCKSRGRHGWTPYSMI